MNYTFILFPRTVQGTASQFPREKPIRQKGLTTSATQDPARYSPPHRISGMGSWRKLLELKAPELRFLAVAFVRVRWVALRLRVQGLATLQQAIGSTPGGESPGDLPPATVARLVATAARRGPFRVACLPRALALQGLLRERGIPAELRIGVRKEGDLFQAHAWVEHQGVALSEPDRIDERFRALRPAAR